MEYLSFDYAERDDSFSMRSLQSHDFFELYFLLSGERMFIIQDKLYRIQPGTLVVIPPYTLHKTEGGACTRVDIYVSSSFLDAHEAEFLTSAHGGCYHMPDDLFKEVRALLMRCFDEEKNPSVHLKTYGPSVLKTILFLLGTKPLPQLTENIQVHSRKEQDELVLEMISYIKEHFKEQMSLDSISREFHLSRVTVCSRFRAVMNCSVMDYVSQTRLNYAKHLLSETDRPIEWIADVSGYSSANYFSLIFKKTVGITPSDFRKINRSPRS